MSAVAPPPAAPGSVPKPAGNKPQVQKSKPELSGPEYWVERITLLEALRERSAAWQDLADAAAEPNVFYEPWYFLPMQELIGTTYPTSYLFVYRRNPDKVQPPILCGFIPLERRRASRLLPVGVLSMWKNRFTSLCTPLLRKGREREVLRTLLDWMHTSPEGAPLWELRHVSGEGPFHQALVDVLFERDLNFSVNERYNRALLRPLGDAESFFAQAFSHDQRHEHRRLRRRLGEQGRLETRVFKPGDDVDIWIEQFLTLEARGWKGEEQTALAAQSETRQYFERVCRDAAARGRLVMLGLFLDDRPIALKCNFLAGDGGFTYKIAFDEAYAKFSPGVQLELDNIEWLHNHPEVRWMDSCAIPRHFMINRLWPDRRTIKKLQVSTGSPSGNLAVALLPLGRTLKRLFMRNSAPASTPAQHRK